MNEVEPTSATAENDELPRWLLAPIGVVLGLFTLLCLAGSTTLIFAPNAKAPIAAPAIGFIMVLACCWVLEKCVRLVSGRKNRGGLMSPANLRFVGWFFLVLPIGGLFTGYFITHTLQAVVQTVAYVSVFFGLRALASWREQNAA